MAEQSWHSPFDAKAQAALNDVLAHIHGQEHSSLYKKRVPKTIDSIEALADIAPTTIETLREHKNALAHYPQEEVRYVASQHESEPADDLFLIPQHIDARWRTLEAYIEEAKPTVATLLVPTFWQLGPLFYHTSRAAGTPVSVMSPRNLPVARQLMADAKNDFVVAEPATAAELQGLLAEEGMGEQVRLWHLIVPVGARVRVPELPGRMSLEYQLFPGTFIGTLMPARTREGVVAITPAPEYFFEIIDSTCFITSMRRDALPLVRFQLPGVWEHDTHEKDDVLIHKQW